MARRVERPGWRRLAVAGLAFLIPLSACASGGQGPEHAPEARLEGSSRQDFAARNAPLTEDVFALMAEADRHAAADLWPGFEFGTIPVAIFDGQSTFLFRHPSPPSAFRAIPGRDGAWMVEGRHPAVTANSTTEIAGVATATVIAVAPEAPLRDRAGVLIHEAFHVFQGSRHPDWIANEVELFAYPMDDLEGLVSRRLETEFLRRALAVSGDDARCWTRHALAARQARVAGFPEGSTAYERHTELYEGLAMYVERRATGRLDAPLFPSEPFAPEAVRGRAYYTGAALARLLDRFRPDWREALERGSARSLDVLLAETLVTLPEAAEPCALSAGELNRIREGAARSITVLRARRAESRERLLAREGWRLVVIAEGVPLFPMGFDPLNVDVVSPGEVLHARFLRLGNDHGSFEMLGHPALTHAAGTHPLFEGVRRLDVTGLRQEPRVETRDGVVILRWDDVTAEVRVGAVDRSERTITVELGITR